MRDMHLRETSTLIQKAVLAAADPGPAVTRALAAARGPDLIATGPLTVISVGKASAGMMRAALSVLGSRVTRGLVVLPHGYPSADLRRPGISVCTAGHPVPDEGSICAARDTIALIQRMAAHEVCLFLLSGGGSSLLSLPHPPLALSDLMETGRLLLASGADIRQINTVRRHLSAVSGGRLAEQCRGTIVTLAISDVVGDDLQAIASGPTVADPTTFAEAAAILERFALLGRVPPAVRSLVQQGLAGAVPETPKAVAPRHRASVIAGGRMIVEAAATAARAAGFAPEVLTTSLTGEARDAGCMLAHAALDRLRTGQQLHACLIAAGETTVTIKGQGKGGRNQEIALSAAMELEGTPGILLTSMATDGKEGNTDAAGAYASGGTVAAGRAQGLDPIACLEANDSHAFLSAAGDLIVTGPTGTNVNDVTFVLVAS